MTEEEFDYELSELISRAEVALGSAATIQALQVALNALLYLAHDRTIEAKQPREADE